MAKKKENLQVQNNVENVEEKAEVTVEAPVEAAEATSLAVAEVIEEQALAPVSLDALGEEIEEIKSKARGIITACEAYTRHACFEIGSRLLMARQSVPEGEYMAWLETVGYSYKTANNLIRIYTDMSSDEVFSALSYSQMCELLPLPLEQRKALAPEVEDKSKNEIRRLVKELKAAEAAKAEAEAAKEEADKAKADAEFLLSKKEEELAEANKERVEHYAARTTAEGNLKEAKKEAKEQAKKAVALLDDAKEEIRAKDEKIEELMATIEAGGKRELTEAEMTAIRKDVEKEVSARLAKEEAKASPAIVELNVILEELQRRFYRVSELLASLGGEQKEKALQFSSQIIQKCLMQNGLISNG